MTSAEGVRYTDRSVWLSAFRKCMGRVPSDEKIPDDMSDEDKCTVVQGRMCVSCAAVRSTTDYYCTRTAMRTATGTM